MRLAAIDVGTNTVRLLVVDLEPGGAWTTVAQDQRVTRLGESLAGSGRLAPAAMTRTGDAVAEYVSRARTLAADEVRIVATSAVREAANGAEFAAAVGRQTGHAIEVIPGGEEARLTLRGVLHGLGHAGGRVVVFDIGGGSTEYIAARDAAVECAVSLRLGVVPLAERFPFPEGASARQYAVLAAAVREQLTRELPAGLVAVRADRLVGTAGTVTTLAALDLGLAAYDARRVQGHVLSLSAVEGLRARLGALSVRARAALPCLEPGRADLIIPGTAIVLETMRLLAADRLTVSDFGLREGLVAERAAGLGVSRI